MFTFIAACQQAATALGKKHKYNLFLLFMLSLAKYPSAVKMLAVLFRKLPARFTVKDLKKTLDNFVTAWAKINDSETVQEEMRCYDDQRMCAKMGVPRMLQKFGVLAKVDETHLTSTKGSKFKQDD